MDGFNFPKIIHPGPSRPPRIPDWGKLDCAQAACQKDIGGIAFPWRILAKTRRRETT